MVKKKASHNIIGIIYDFDGTLSPHNMQEDTIFKAYGIEKNELWTKSKELVTKCGYERTLAYLKLLIHDPAFEHKPLRREELTRLAEHVEYAPGVPDFFDAINGFVSEIDEVKQWDIQLEHYVISSGMMEILEGTKIFLAVDGPSHGRRQGCRFFESARFALFVAITTQEALITDASVELASASSALQTGGHGLFFAAPWQ